MQAPVISLPPSKSYLVLKYRQQARHMREDVGSS
jgi:hypothetical protein